MSISDFQSPGLGSSPRKDNEPGYSCHQHHHYTLCGLGNRILLITTNEPRPRKAITL